MESQRCLEFLNGKYIKETVCHAATHPRRDRATPTLSLTLLLRLPFPRSPLSLVPFLRREVERDAVDAVPLVGGRGKALALEDVAQVAAAVGAHDLGAHHAQAAVLVPLHRPRDAVEVGRPAAARRELVLRPVQRRAASRACVHPRLGVVLVVLAGARRLRALFAENAELFCFSMLIFKFFLHAFFFSVVSCSSTLAVHSNSCSYLLQGQ